MHMTLTLLKIGYATIWRKYIIVGNRLLVYNYQTSKMKNKVYWMYSKIVIQETKRDHLRSLLIVCDLLYLHHSRHDPTSPGPWDCWLPSSTQEPAFCSAHTFTIAYWVKIQMLENNNRPNKNDKPKGAWKNFFENNWIFDNRNYPKIAYFKPTGLRK